MLTANDFRRIVLGMEGASEGAHMGHPDFRVDNRIFASLHDDDKFGMVKLTPDEQRSFLRAHPGSFEPESGAWGLQGCTRVLLHTADEEPVGEAVTLAWRGIVSKGVRRPRAASAKGRSAAAHAKPGAAPKKHAARMRSFSQLVARYPSEVQDLARRARALIRELLPKSKESIDQTGPYVSYGYGPGYKGIVSYLTVSQKGVKLGVAYGASVPDPNRLLQGSGTSARHVVIRTPKDLRRPGLRPLVRAALAAWKKDNA